MKHLKEIWPHIRPRRQLQLGGMGILMLLSSVAEMVSLGLVIPFLGAISYPDKLFANTTLAPFIEFFKIHTPAQLLPLFTLLFICAALVSAFIKILQLWLNTKLAFSIGAEISAEIYKRTLHQPYSVHIAHNSSEVISGVVTKSYAVIYGGLMPVLQFSSGMVTLVVIGCGLLAVNPLIVMSTFLAFGLAYLMLIMVVRTRLSNNGKLIAMGTTMVFKHLQDGLGGIRDVLMGSSQSAYCEFYRQADFPLRRAQGDNQFVSASPRFVMEAVALIMISALSYHLVQQPAGLEAALPFLGVLALSAQRLLPVLQQAYSAWVSMKGSAASVQEALFLLNQPLPKPYDHVAANFRFDSEIHLNAITFKYNSESRPVLKELDLVIKKGEKIGIMGVTGSGKSTLMDILMGLLVPTAGTLEVDGEVIGSSNCSSWRSKIAHVPQMIYLADDSLEANIAFGTTSDVIDRDRIRESARQAQLSDFIESMPDGYLSRVGERGIGLSGGQRQRVGIARALYRRAELIVFDEATSALDNETESMVMESIEMLNPDLTIVIIAHRLSTLRKCDRIYELSGGRVLRSGTYAEMVGA